MRAPEPRITPVESGDSGKMMWNDPDMEAYSEDRAAYISAERKLRDAICDMRSVMTSASRERRGLEPDA